MILSAPLRQFTHLVGSYTPRYRAHLIAHTSMLKTSMTLIANSQGDTTITRGFRGRDNETRERIERLCSGVFPRVLNVAVIDAETVHLTFADDEEAIAFTLEHCEEIELTAVEP